MVLPLSIKTREVDPSTTWMMVPLTSGMYLIHLLVHANFLYCYYYYYYFTHSRG